jgi:hypothetical protein
MGVAEAPSGFDRVVSIQPIRGNQAIREETHQRDDKKYKQSVRYCTESGLSGIVECEIKWSKLEENKENKKGI